MNQLFLVLDIPLSSKEVKCVVTVKSCFNLQTAETTLNILSSWYLLTH